MRFVHIVVLLVSNEFLKEFKVVADFSQGIPSLNDGLQAEDKGLHLEPVNGTRDYRVQKNRDENGKPWHDERKERYIIHCVRPAKCERLQSGTCFGSKIPYKFTSLALTDASTQLESREELYKFEALRNVPKCWAVIQPFLCSVFIPKCEKFKNREMVYLPSLEMCRITSEPCRILYNSTFFPEFLKCRETFFPCKNCSNDVREMKFNATGQCLSPLVPTESVSNYYKDVEGCGIQCKDPMYTDEEHETVHTLILYGALICLICNVFVIATFLIHDWKHSKHPAWILFYISICFLCNWFGWIMQFLPFFGPLENIVCRRDGTLRYAEPSAGENLNCIAPFLSIYYSLIAANVWFSLFTYSWYLQTTDRGSIRDRIDKESSYFHFIAWSMPFVLTVTIMILSEVDGNSITGICFVGYRNRSVRLGLVLTPVAILSLISVFFTFKGALNLNRIRKSTSSSDESKKLNSHILGMGIRTMLAVFFIFAFFVFESYEMRNAKHWAASLNEFIICKIRNSYSFEHSACKIKNRPSIAILQLRLLCLFCVNLVIASWCWTRPAFKTWDRFARKKIGYELSDDEKFTKPKHRIIADAYAKRLEDVISVSIQNSHTDPANLNFELNNLNSTESNGMGTTLTNYLYNIINRRNAVTSMDFGEPTMNCARGSSCDSEISFSVRQISVESRRSSVDSQVSVKLSETEIKAKVERRSQKHKRVNMNAKKRQGRYYARRTNRRPSNSSIESQRLTDQLQLRKYNYTNNRIQVNAKPIDSIMNSRQNERRSACTASDINDMKLINRNDLQRRISLITTSDDDQSNNESQQIHIEHGPSSMVSLGAHGTRRTDNSADSLEVSNGTQHSQTLEQTLYPIIKNILRNSNGKQLESLLKSSYDRNDVGLGGIRKSCRKSTKNSNVQRNSHNKSQQHKRQPQYATAKLRENAQNVIISSSLDLDIPLDGTHSSFSDQSVNRIKTRSQNSQKSQRSCDVGIQANSYDISSYNSRQQPPADGEKDDLPEKLQSRCHADDFTETHQLLPLPFKRRETASIISRKDSANMSEKEKLAYLLLP